MHGNGTMYIETQQSITPMDETPCSDPGQFEIASLKEEAHRSPLNVILRFIL